MKSNFDVQGKVCLVTGGSRGLGLGMARALGQAGARVAITARKPDELERARASLAADGIVVRAFVNDLAEYSSSPTLVTSIHDALGPIDVLVNNAGATWGAPAAELDWRGWQKVIDVNLNGTWALTQAVATQCMLPRSSGSIIIVASVNGLGGIAPGGVPTVAYNTSKAGQINLARSLAAEWGVHGIRVNSILPGWFPTKMAHGTIEDQGGGLLSRIPLGRFGEPDHDLNGPILFLASDASRYVTGHALVVDGGMSAVI